VPDSNSAHPVQATRAERAPSPIPVRPSSGTTLSAVQRLLPLLSAQGADTERERRVSDELHAALLEAGCYRMLVPRALGGNDLPFSEFLEVIEALAGADAAAAWTVSQAALAQVILSPLPLSTLMELYTVGPDLVVSGVLAPKGRARRTDDGWHVSGRWPFASGSTHARYFYAQSVIMDGRRLETDAQGRPCVRLTLHEKSDVRVIDTWDALGLRGTASHDIGIDGVFCPAQRSWSITDPPSLSTDTLRIPLMDQGGFYVAAVALGIARGAIDDVVALARGGKRPSFGPRPLAESPIFHDLLGEHYMRLCAARALLYGQAQRAVRAAEMSATERAALRATCLQVLALCSSVVDMCYTQAASSSVYQDSPLQRRLRDLRVATQHVWNNRDHAGSLGAALVGSVGDVKL